ncbi:MAG: hypothetical protein KDA48_17290, partial [Amphiplicatus sp.]|nr:hypothetical protein [Amphiplicatus sp.]
MIGLDFPKTTERLFKEWKPIHLVITLAITLVLVASIDRFSPHGQWVREAGIQKQYKIDHERVVLRWRDRADPRSFTTPEDTGLSPEDFGLAWISGSSISIRANKPEYFFHGVSAYELTDVFAAQTKSIDGRPLYVHEYLIQGVRTGDVRRAALHASKDPLVDAIAISLNPVWLFNDTAVLTESNQRASIVAMNGARLEDWVLAPGYARPSALTAALLTPHSRLLQARFAISEQLALMHSKELPFPFLKKGEAKKLTYPDIKDYFPDRDFNAPPDMKWIAGYRATLLKQSLREGAPNSQFFKLMLRSLAESKKPVLLYVPPLPPEAEHDAALVEFMDDWQAFTRKMVANYGGDNIHLYTASLFKVDGERVHKDIVHLYYGQGVADTVADLIQSELGLKLERIPPDGMYGE